VEAAYGSYFIRKHLYKPFWIMDNGCSAPTKTDNGIMRFGAQDNGVMRFGAHDNAIMRFGAQDNGIMKVPQSHERRLDIATSKNQIELLVRGQI
jgi:hypothetical protein